MHQTYSAYQTSRNWHNSHHDIRHTWLVSPWAEPQRPNRGGRISHLLTRLGGVILSLPPEWRPKRRQKA